MLQRKVILKEKLVSYFVKLDPITLGFQRDNYRESEIFKLKD